MGVGGLIEVDSGVELLLAELAVFPGGDGVLAEIRGDKGGCSWVWGVLRNGGRGARGGTFSIVRRWA